MEDLDDETDLREQIFHNNVREQIVSNLTTSMYFYWDAKIHRGGTSVALG